MALMLDLRITTRDGGTVRLGMLEIRRLTLLHSDKPADERHRYVVKRYTADGSVQATTEITHRYGDGAWIAAMRALMGLVLGERHGREGDAIRDALEPEL